MRSKSSQTIILLGIILGFFVLGCQITDMVTQLRPTPINTVAARVATIRPTFTPAPPTIPVPPTDEPPPIVPTNALPPSRPSPTRTSPPRPTATRVVAAAPPQPAPTITIDLYQGYFYRVAKSTCVAATNTRIEGTVLNNGTPQNGVRVRLSSGKYEAPVINDFVTGTDPNDAKHISPEWTGRYRLSPAEGQRIDGNWWVFIVDNSEQPISVAQYIKTHDTAGCNTATVDFAH